MKTITTINPSKLPTKDRSKYLNSYHIMRNALTWAFEHGYNPFNSACGEEERESKFLSALEDMHSLVMIPNANKCLLLAAEEMYSVLKELRCNAYVSGDGIIIKMDKALAIAEGE